MEGKWLFDERKLTNAMLISDKKLKDFIQSEILRNVRDFGEKVRGEDYFLDCGCYHSLSERIEAALAALDKKEK